MQLYVEVNQEQMRRIDGMIGGLGKVGEKIANRALDRVLQSTKKELAEEIARTINLKPAQIKKVNISYRRHGMLSGTLTIDGSRIPLMQFDPRMVPGGISYAVRRGGGRKTVRGAFFAKVRSGQQAQHTAVWVRRYRASQPAPEDVRRDAIFPLRDARLTPSGSLSLMKLYAESVPKVAEEILGQKPGYYEQRMAEKLDEEIGRNIDLYLAGQGNF